MTELTDKEKQRLEFARTHRGISPIMNINFEGNVISRENFIIGSTALIGFCCVIGDQGFGFARDEEGKLVRIQHAGGVMIGKDVEIGSNTCIDRATKEGEFTEIGDGTKIDNLVHIAHNCKIGKHNLIVAGSIIGGSVIIGDYCFLGMGCMIKNKVKIGNNVTIGAGAVVLKDVPDNATVYGNPARAKEEHAAIKIIAAGSSLYQHIEDILARCEQGNEYPNGFIESHIPCSDSRCNYTGECQASFHPTNMKCLASPISPQYTERLAASRGEKQTGNV